MWKAKNWINDEMDQKLLEILGVEDVGIGFWQICAVLNIGTLNGHRREVRRGLQRLRKADKIFFDAKAGWKLNEVP
jgi:hypothetical protein